MRTKLATKHLTANLHNIKRTVGQHGLIANCILLILININYCYIKQGEFVGSQWELLVSIAVH